MVSGGCSGARAVDHMQFGLNLNLVIHYLMKLSSTVASICLYSTYPSLSNAD